MVKTRFVCLLLMLLVAGTAARGATAGFTQIWKGEALWPFLPDGGGKYAGSKDPKEWQGIPGATLSFNYSGKGPLPAPKDFVIKLDKPLPLGPSYRLFVKNFYVGNMEATLGDVTRPLTIRRYEWTPGVPFEPNAPVDKIVLRYFPSNFVADNGAPQEQSYIIQGVFLTTETNKVPIRGGEIIETLPNEKPKTRQGNYLQNAGFEVGLFPWGKPFGVSAVYGPENLDASATPQGKYSFKRELKQASGPLKNGGEQQILQSRNYPLAPGRYTLSFYAKANKPVSLTASVMGATEDLKASTTAGVNQTSDLTDQWQRYSVTGDLTAMPGFLYYLNFAVRSNQPATIWLDAVQLQNGEMTEFQPAKATEVGYSCSTIGNIFYEGQGSDVDLLVHDATGGQQATVNFRVIDYWGQEVAKGQKQVPISEKAGKVALTLPASKKGIFRVLFSAADSTSEMIYSVLTPNPHLDSVYLDGTLGIDATFDEKQLAILKRANFNWVLSKFLARWYLIEKEQGKYDFDESIATAAQAGMSVALQPLNIEWGMQKWLLPYWKPPGGSTWEPAKKAVYLQHWGKFVYELVNHYKGTVKHWEIENEPNAAYSASEYAELLNVAIENARKADPQAKIVGFSGGGYVPAFYETVLQSVSPARIDVFSVHFYTGNESGVFAKFTALLKKYNKPGWNTETGTTCPTFFTTLPEYDALRQKDYWQGLQQEVRTQSVGTAQNYLLTMSVGGMEKYFYYFCRFVNSGPSQPTSRFGSGKELAEFDGSLRANAVALCVASHFVDGAKYFGPVQLDERLQVHVYQKGGGAVGFLWGRPEQVLSLAATGGLSFFDIMGNAIAGQTLRVTDSPIYFTFKGDAKSCQTLLSAMKVTAGK